jgi:outer membrane protein TolC
VAVQKKSLALAERLLDENRARVAVGVMSPLALAEAEAEVASRREAVLAALAWRGDVEAALKRIVFPKSDAETRALTIVPTSGVDVDDDTAPDVEAAVAAALQKRTDVAALRQRLEIVGASAELAQDKLRPHLDLTASVGMTGIGGTRLRPEPGTAPTTAGYGGALRDLVRSEHPTWSVGVDVSVPVGNHQATAAAARARADRAQIEAEVRRLEMRIATEIESAARSVLTGRERLAASRAARALQAKRLEAEEGRAATGSSTTFLLTQAQRDLAAAESAERRAATAYRQSRIELDRLQEAGVASDTASLNLGPRALLFSAESPTLPARPPLAAAF